MFAFVLRRLFQAVFVMIAVALIAFMLFQYVGDPVLFMLGQDATADQVRELRELLGLDRSVLVQFWHFLLNAAQGDFGISLRQGGQGLEIDGRTPARHAGIGLRRCCHCPRHRYSNGRVCGTAQG